MVSRITAALAARFKAIQEKEKGFTLIELLVVVIIIGVLAAIAIPIYIGVQNTAKDSGVKSDLSNAKIAVVAFQTDGGGTLTLTDASGAGSTALQDFGWTKSADTTTLALKTLPAADGSFCIDGVSSTGATFSITDAAGISDSACA